MFIRELCRWLWAKLLQKELDKMVEFRNGAMMRKDKNKPGPSGMSRNQAFSLPESWGGINCLLGIPDMAVIHEMKVKLGGERLLAFSTPEFGDHAQQVFDSLNIKSFSFSSVWAIFETMVPLLCK